MHGAHSAQFAAILSLALLGLGAAGCSPTEAGVSVPSEPIAAPATATAGKSDRQNEVSLRIADETELAALLLSHRGSVVLVDFWATWCLPCVELFPHTVELHQRLADQGLVVISVNFDDPESEPDVRRFLAQKGAAFENLISPYGVTPKAVEAFGIENGALPYLRLYDRTGLARKSFGDAHGAFTVEEVDEAVRQLLRQP